MLCWDPYGTAWLKSHSVPQPGQVPQYLEPNEQLWGGTVLHRTTGKMEWLNARG